MRIERNAFETHRALAVTELREKCMGCTDCDGPCLMLMQLSQLPEIVLHRAESRP